MHKYTIGFIGGVLVAIATNFTAPITVINFITALFFGIFKLFCTMIGCFLAYIVFIILGRCIPIITSKMWEQVCWTWQQVKDYEESDAEI